MTTQEWFSEFSSEQEPLAVGGFAVIYPLSKTRVAKIPREAMIYGTKFYNIDGLDLNAECSMHNSLYEAGFQVPKPEGIFDVHLEGRIERAHGHSKIVKGFVSQRIYGATDFNKLPEHLRSVAEQQFVEQLKRAAREGFVPNFDAMKNTIFDDKEKKLYLIDFHLWERK